jgi:hypothetical protein
MESQNVYQRLQKLKEKTSCWTEDDIKEYEACDEVVIQGMLWAENKTRHVKTTAWSPKFGAAVAKKSFWKIALSLKTNCKLPSHGFLRWAESMDIIDFKGITLQNVKKELKKAQCEL